MNSTQNCSADLAAERKKLTRVLQEPLTFIILVWSLMLTLVGICFAFTE